MTDMPKLFNRNYTYFLRGLCMLMIIFSLAANEFADLLLQYHLDCIWKCGKFATGIFFFLSGYGLSLSIRRNEIDKVYICRHIKNLLRPYLVFWLFYILMGLYTEHLSLKEPFYFFLLKIPNADSWFFRTILGIYVAYLTMARFFKPYADIGITVCIVAYAVVLMSSDAPFWWWNTILCFPVGILYAHCSPVLAKHASVKYLPILIGLFIVFYEYFPFYYAREICPPVICCLFCFYLSPVVKKPQKKPALMPLINLVSFIGHNSLYMYFMAAIPMAYMNPGKVGFAVYVSGCMSFTIMLTCLAKKLKPYLSALLGSKDE